MESLDISDTFDILMILKKYGGIYLDFSVLTIGNKNLSKLLKLNFFKSKDNKIIGSEINSFIIKKYLIDKDFNEKFGVRYINNSFVNNLILDNEICIIDNDVFREINDYSFSNYFHLIKTYDWININSVNNKNLSEILNTTSTYNLLVKYILGHVHKDISELSEFSELSELKHSLINNIDYIFWINLDESLQRKDNMLNILKTIIQIST